VVVVAIGAVGVRVKLNSTDPEQADTPAVAADRVTQALKLHLFSTHKE
jgi:hypothetical protein